MRLRSPKLFDMLLPALCLGGFLVAGHFAATALIGWQQQRQLREISTVALRRSEGAVDYALRSLADLTAGGPVGCDTQALQRTRLHVYQRGPVKDIRIADRNGFVQCSAYSETLEFDKQWLSRDEMLVSSDPAVRLFRVDQFFGTALGVMKDTGADGALIAVLGVTPSLFDIMPGELRNASNVVLELSDGGTVTHTGEDDAAGANAIQLTARSDTYPFHATVKVNPAALGRWQQQPYWPILALAGLLGAAFGILLWRNLSRPLTPVEELDRAIAAREFRPYFQPIFDLETRRILGAEVLARWPRADGTFTPPSRFIALAEDTGRIEAITWQLLRQALEALQPTLRHDRSFRLSVNISPRQFVQPGFAESLSQAVAECKVATRQLTLELTERSGFENLHFAAAVVAQVRELGFRVALDDVGIGHSGLSHIQQLKVDTLKIDKFFVDTIDGEGSTNTVVEMLVRLASEMRIGLVAEGIEREEQASALLACGIRQGQGYLSSPAVPAGAFLESLARQDAARPAAGPEERAAA